jgi:hypothetical protein
MIAGIPWHDEINSWTARQIRQNRTIELLAEIFQTDEGRGHSGLPACSACNFALLSSSSVK